MKGLVLVAALTACAPLIGPSPDDNPDAAPGDILPNGKVTTRANDDGSATTLVDSSSDTDWTYIDIAAFTESDANGPWDLRFQRFHISVDGGISGDGNVAVAPVIADFDSVTTAPADGYLQDAPDGDDENTIPEYAFEQGDGWYDYDVDTHVLTPKKIVWVVRSTDTTIKLAIDKYYDSAGTAGWFTVTWRKL
ncbi:MAG TPA: HmuY family protein [Kofleriaceae bacterium]